MTYGKAFDLINDNTQNLGMRLPMWNDEVLIKVQFPDEKSKMTAPYLYVQSRFGVVPWKETMIELFDDRWLVK